MLHWPFRPESTETYSCVLSIRNYAQVTIIWMLPTLEQFWWTRREPDIHVLCNSQQCFYKTISASLILLLPLGHFSFRFTCIQHFHNVKVDGHNEKIKRRIGVFIYNQSKVCTHFFLWSKCVKPRIWNLYYWMYIKYFSKTAKLFLNLAQHVIMNKQKVKSE